MLQHIRKSVQHEEGATAVEYGIMVALIAAVIVLVVLFLGRQVQQGFCDVSANLSAGGITATGPGGVTTAGDC